MPLNDVNQKITKISPMRKLSLILATLLVITTLSACNTIRGIGQDIGAAGDAIEDSAEKNKKY